MAIIIIIKAVKVCRGRPTVGTRNNIDDKYSLWPVLIEILKGYGHFGVAVVTLHPGHSFRSPLLDCHFFSRVVTFFWHLSDSRHIAVRLVFFLFCAYQFFFFPIVIITCPGRGHDLFYGDNLSSVWLRSALSVFLIPFPIREARLYVRV